MEVLKERQVHSITVGAHNLVNQTQSNKQSHQPHPASQEQALAKLQAQRLSRAEQRLTAATRPANVLAAEVNHAAVGSQHAAACSGTAAPKDKRRLRAKVTTTAGTGMQRQAPSRCGSNSCSVRGSLESLPHQQQLQQPRNRPSGTAAQSLFSSPPQALGMLHVTGSLLQIQGTGVSQLQQQQQQQPRVHASSRPVGLSHHGSGSGSSLRPQCQQAVLRAPATASRARGLASASAAALAPAFMGCGAAWGELQAAAVGSAALQPPKGGSNLEHRRQVQQCRWAI